jgi:hypothetical protein
MSATEPIVMFVMILAIGIVAGILFDRLAGPSWLTRQFTGSTRGIVTSALVPLHRGFDWLIFGHFRMGRFSGATSSSMLRATPGWRRIKPARSMVRTI